MGRGAFPPNILLPPVSPQIITSVLKLDHISRFHKRKNDKNSKFLPFLLNFDAGAATDNNKKNEPLPNFLGFT